MNWEQAIIEEMELQMCFGASHDLGLDLFCRKVGIARIAESNERPSRGKPTHKTAAKAVKGKLGTSYASG